MPKVNSDYIDKKKNVILDAAFIVFKQKPLYEMTMLDVIKVAGLSKGGIYRYFRDIDEVIIALINRETAQNSYKHKIDEIIGSSNSIEKTINELFIFLGKYINESPLELGKFQFELTVLLSSHPEKAEKFMSNLTEHENGQYFINVLFNKIIEGVNKKKFEPMFPLEDIFSYITTSIDGLVNDFVLRKCYTGDAYNMDAVKIMKIISTSVLHMLGSSNN